MVNLRKILTLKAVMVLCAVAQIIIAMPHHHHEGSEVPCFNILHCVDSHVHAGCDHSGCAHDHSGAHQHDSDDSQCTLTHLDLNFPTREQNANGVSSVDLAHVPIIAVGMSADILGEIYKDNASKVAHRVCHGAESTHVRYIISALPPRAPAV